MALGIAVGLLVRCSSPPEEPARLPDQRLSGNGSETCWIDPKGELFCWGSLGDAAHAHAAPTRLGSGPWRAVSVGADHACGIRVDGTLWCWGSNCAGQLGDGTQNAHAEPLQFGSDDRWARVAVGGGHTCAIDGDGTLTCWGGHDYGQNDCTKIPMQPPTQVAGTWKEVSTHYYSIYAIQKNGSLWRLQDNPFDDSPLWGPPTQVGVAAWRTVATGIGMTEACGVRTDGALACVDAEATTETRVGGELDWVDVATRDHTCATRTDQSLWCFGRNDSGQVGQGTPMPKEVPAPVRVGADLGWTAITAGWFASCGMRSGQVLCWGSNKAGELGLGAVDDGIHAPAAVHF